MSDITDINTKKTRIARLLSEATSVPAKSRSLPPGILSTLFILIAGTMLPISAATPFFSVTVITLATLFSILAVRKIISFDKKIGAAVGVMLCLSALSGCGPVLFTEDLPDFGGLERQTDIKTHTITRFGVFGFGLDDATTKQAQLEGDIEDLIAVKIDRGYGLISMARVSVAGK